jgi:arginine-tRNA-protein transferase
MCQSLRIPVDAFRPDRSQRRAWKANEGSVTVRIGAPVLTVDRLELYRRFHLHQADAKQWPMPEPENLVALVDNPFPTEEWSYWLGERLIGVGYVDALAGGLSAIYFYYEPAERDRSLGTFNVLSVIASARQRALSHVYLGYYIDGYGSLAYKARFRPNEVRAADGQWKPFAT